MFLLKLAILNINRNPRRSFITVLAVAVGLAALIFLWGFSDGTIERQRDNVVRLFTGHVQIHTVGFEQSLSPELVLKDRLGIVEKIQSQPHVVTLTERVKAEALIGTSQNSRGVLMIGVDPLREPLVIEIREQVKEGHFLSPVGNREVLVGYRLAEKLGVHIGDKVVIMTQAIDGTLAGYAYRVRGILHTGSLDLDELSIYTTLQSAQELLGLEKEVHELVIRLTSRAAIPGFLNAVKKTLDETPYEILTWDDIIPSVNQWASWAEAIIRTILVTVTIVIGVGIMNTIVMSVFERTRELGVMMAIGTSPAQIIRLILLETLVLECFGVVLGVIAGYLVTFYFGIVGIHFYGVEEAFSATYMSTVTYTQVKGIHVIQSILTLVAVTSLIGIYPAWKAGRMVPVKAIYHSY
ncbi:MAG: ABC transporter permease [Candidatus Omnitrophica bacterium]|nr:ABC transporter permease [Candidatus Omnitrophota bacterium]